MKDTKTDKPAKFKTSEKPSFFKRIVNKVDSAMKAKADQQSEESNCCGGSGSSDGKGGKCC